MDLGNPKNANRSSHPRNGMTWIIGIAIFLCAALAGGWTIYLGAVVGWENRSNSAASLTQPATDATKKELVIVEDLQPQIPDSGQQALAKIDRCIDGTAFRKLPDGGWENIPGVSCP